MTNNIDEIIEATACRMCGEDLVLITLDVPSVVYFGKRESVSMTINQQELLNFIEELKGLVK